MSKEVAKSVLRNKRKQRSIKVPVDVEQAIASLPKWAQLHISKLEADLQHAEKQAAEIYGTEETDTYVENYAANRRFGENQQRLPKGAIIRFELSKDHWSYVNICVREGKLIVHGGRPIFVSPQAANAVEIQ